MSKAIVNTLESLETGEQFDVRDIAQLSAGYQRQKNQIFLELRRLAAEAGFNLVEGSFEEGAVISGWPDVVWCQALGIYLQWHLDEAKAVVAGNSPTNIGVDWIDKTDAALRSEINVIQRRFNTIAEMKAVLTTADIGKVVEWVGYSNIFDGGGNRGVVVPAETGTDDGGHILTVHPVYKYGQCLKVVKLKSVNLALKVIDL